MMDTITIAVINTLGFGSVQLHNHDSLLIDLDKASKVSGITVLVLINNFDSEEGQEVLQFYKYNHPNFKVITSPLCNVGTARQLLYDECKSEWIIYQDEDDEFCDGFLTNIVDIMKKDLKVIGLITNKFDFINPDGSVEWTCPNWYVENQMLRMKDFKLYHGGSFSLVGSFIHKSILPEFRWPNAEFAEDLIASLYLYKIGVKVAYAPVRISKCIKKDSTLTKNRIKSNDENDLDILSGVLPLELSCVL